MSASQGSISVSMPWQDQQWARFVQLLQGDKLPHALLLAGPSGVGKRRFAMAVAHYLMCESPEIGMACGNCRQCLLNKAVTHPDFKCLEPEESGKQIKVDLVRELVSYLGHTSQQGGYKVAVLAPAEAMNMNAANALLKSLEEPAPNTLLLLVSDNPGQLLPTIRSRCQLLKFPLPARDLAVQWLTTVLPAQDDIGHLLDEASGQPLTAQKLLTGDRLERREQLNADLLALLSGRAAALNVAASWKDHDLGEVLDWLSRKLMMLISCKVGGGEVAVSLPQSWQAVVVDVDPCPLFGLLDKINLLKSRLDRGANPNHQLALEALLLKTCDKFHTAA